MLELTPPEVSIGDYIIRLDFKAHTIYLHEMWVIEFHTVELKYLVKAEMIVGSKNLRIWSWHFCGLAYGLWKMSYPYCIVTQLFHELLGQAYGHSIAIIDDRNHSFTIILTS